MTSRTPCLAGLRPLSCSCLLTIWVAPENRLAKLRTPRTYCFNAGFSGAPNGVRLQSGRAASGTAHNPGPNNPNVKTGSTPSTISSILEVPGERPAFYDGQPVPHGEDHTHWYRSKSLNALRRLTVYTPPGYGRNAHTRYPALYLR